MFCEASLEWAHVSGIIAVGLLQYFPGLWMSLMDMHTLSLHFRRYLIE